MAGGREDPHVRVEFGHDYLGGTPADPGDLIQALNQGQQAGPGGLGGFAWGAAWLAAPFVSFRRGDLGEFGGDVPR
ncbi:hypothetical protein OG991_57275 [Streptomyces mirabilis]|nr:hypothetical protein [Streptomyces mirabilis]MCX4428821.1 hypothetical protein [Streptomyces mirabilis]